MSVLVPRNSAIPAKKEGNITTKRDNQTSIIISVYEGERARATDKRDNQTSIIISVYEGETARATDKNFLGEFVLHGIPAAPRGVAQVKV